MTKDLDSIATAVIEKIRTTQDSRYLADIVSAARACGHDMSQPLPITAEIVLALSEVCHQSNVYQTQNGWDNFLGKAGLSHTESRAGDLSIIPLLIENVASMAHDFRFFFPALKKEAAARGFLENIKRTVQLHTGDNEKVSGNLRQTCLVAAKTFFEAYQNQGKIETLLQSIKLIAVADGKISDFFQKPNKPKNEKEAIDRFFEIALHRVQLRNTDSVPELQAQLAKRPFNAAVPEHLRPKPDGKDI